MVKVQMCRRHNSATGNDEIKTHTGNERAAMAMEEQWRVKKSCGGYFERLEDVWIIKLIIIN